MTKLIRASKNGAAAIIVAQIHQFALVQVKS